MTDRRPHRWATLAGALLACALGPAPARAGLSAAFVALGEIERPLQVASLSDARFLLPSNPTVFEGAYTLAGTGVAYVPAPGVTSTLTSAGVGVLGAVDMHFAYGDRNPLAAGTSQTVNYDIIISPSDPILVETLSLTFTGSVNTDTGSNMVVDLHWLSSSTNGLLPPPLANARVIDEYHWLLKDLQGDVHAVTGLSDFHALFMTIPEPSSAVTTALGLLVLGGLALRRRVV